MGYVIASALMAVAVMWCITVRRRLMYMDENIDNAMSQICVQLSARLTALNGLLHLTKEYCTQETRLPDEGELGCGSIITASASPREVVQQERAVAESIRQIRALSERYPELKAQENYDKYMNAMDTYEKMVCTGSLIYNDSVSKLNRELCRFPASLVGSLCGVRKREYLEISEVKYDKAADILS